MCRENVAVRSVCARAMLEATDVSLYTGVRFTLRARRLHSLQKEVCPTRRGVHKRSGGVIRKYSMLDISGYSWRGRE